MEDAQGENFPWLPPTIEEALGNEFVRNDGSKVSAEELKGKYLALYFSAHWCPPCRAFTVPVLKPVYEKVTKDKKNWEVIFISADKGEKEFKEYFGEQPWLAVPFDDKKRSEALNRIFEVQGIPTLIQLSPERQVINKALRGAVSGDPEGKDFPWLPKPVQSLDEIGGELNELPALIMLMEDESSTTQAQFSEIIHQVAQAHIPKVKAGQQDEVAFGVVTEQGGIAGQVRKLTKLDGASTETRTLCNGDMCMKLAGPTRVLLLDIPDSGGFYTLDGDITNENIKSFFAAYLAGELKGERKQLG
jgi:nucleoredoxin